MITAADCRQQATLYEAKAKAEGHVGMRAALLDLSRSWVAMAERIERIEQVREINSQLH
jgi:hypothetical protein